MDLSLTLLLLAVAAFVGVHIVLALPTIRSRLVGRLGETGFSIVYTVQAVILLVLVVLAYRDASYQPLWFVSWGSWLPVLVMPIALWLLVGSLSTRNPTAAGPAGQAAPDPRKPLPLYTAITRHPMLWGILLWALAHIVANGDVGSLFLFGGMGVLSVAGMWGIDAKKKANPAFDFAALAARTSLVPFAATLGGRNRLQATRGDLFRLVVALVLYAGLMHGHAWLFGVSALPA